ncbi:glycoside hydrolase family 130 protein [Clostridium tyrobutyricum]|uniref:glycoside hydrolase family 130 protein n=1 Tax=Clostridium tyrobutyricum TaxID=1519 RepID=UPI0002E607D1|nr:glycoside hydrolase family 130 protein [Clostridium tyrobutyricum]MEA5008635.1 glycoside hydrolase family 130 protein [Clostridium tyrobutyricum]
MNIIKYKYNPIITFKDVVPSNSKFQVIGAFNAGAIQYNEETILLLRVAERVKQSDEKCMEVPIFNNENRSLDIMNISRENKNYDFTDSRVVRRMDSNSDFSYLTSMSHIRLARSKDGFNFKIDDKTFIFPDNKYESFGIEDPRITRIDDNYYITYSAVSNYGIVVGLAVTKDFKNYKRLGNIFSTENKDVVIFPERINGKYFALNRPVSKSTGKPIIWISESNDLIHWGNHEILADTRENYWDCKKIGAGVPPIKTKHGWLELYHGVDENEHYCMGALLLQLDYPKNIIARSETPILVPSESYETEGFFPNVIFSCGAVERCDKLYIYYGISDNSIGLAITSIDDILNTLIK